MKYLDATTVDKIRRGYYSAVYFNRTKSILEGEKNFKKVTMQIFQKHEGSVLCGVEEVMELLRQTVGYYESGRSHPEFISGFHEEWIPDQVRNDTDVSVQHDKNKPISKKWVSKWEKIKIESLSDGDKLKSWDTVMHITGPYAYFAHLESLYLGILARRTLVATNTRKVVDAAAGKSVIFFADRFDYFLNQEGDGYAAKIGGSSAVCTEAHTVKFDGEPVGTIPHALIALYDGSTVKAVEQFHQAYRDVNLIALVDFENDCVKTSLEVAKALGNKLWGVRLDTAENIVDKSLQPTSPLSSPTRRGNLKGEVSGVNPTLVKLVRQALDQEGFGHVKIIVSGGFNEDKIKWFEKEKTPVDIYGVGSALVHGENDFTADIVKVEDRLIAKVGREYKPIKSKR